MRVGGSRPTIVRSHASTATVARRRRDLDQLNRLLVDRPYADADAASASHDTAAAAAAAADTVGTWQSQSWRAPASRLLCYVRRVKSPLQRARAHR